MISVFLSEIEYHLLIGILTIWHVFSTSQRFAMRRLITTSCIKNQSEIYCIIQSALLKVKKIKYHAGTLDCDEGSESPVINKKGNP